MAQSIQVSYFDREGLTDKIRFTSGQSHENNALLGGIRRLSAAEKAASSTGRGRRTASLTRERPNISAAKPKGLANSAAVSNSESHGTSVGLTT